MLGTVLSTEDTTQSFSFWWRILHINLLAALFYGWKHYGLEWLSNLLKIEVINDGIGVSVPVSDF